ncbi:vitamin B12 dependent-methionine synthase activation domain-containing protein [Mangrovibacterium diazotrophicum]|uniref:Cobalamin-dependent methionine synthase-like protein n=1 Tax=Mangrovibacterium diazotrophicum TaxID=1261403 RepID=A0A419W483_9BACT|nr:vitamin B12 dependent-methionine synthase activation domain-containing protein [Mangrovibacterium diazotrophicum]RKD90271.1 cobalamin-dependent methionine synthase-like protein [Mangrovibacterium diazotrophicum]
MIRVQTFRFRELAVDTGWITRELGFSSTKVPENWQKKLDRALEFAENLTDISASWQVLRVDPEVPNQRMIQLEEALFTVGKTIARELHNSQQAALFICTAGAVIDTEAKRQSQSGDADYGKVLGLVGIAIAEAVADRVHEKVKQIAAKRDFKVTNRYSPGYCHWHIADQHQLFALFGDENCGVNVTKSASLDPVNSVSGIVGLGSHVEFHGYQCKLCKLEHCMHRRVQ